MQNASQTITAGKPSVDGLSFAKFDQLWNLPEYEPILLKIYGIPVRLNMKEGRGDIEVMTADGLPSELSAFDLSSDAAAVFLAELPQLVAASPRLAATPRVDRAAVRQLQVAGVPNAFAAAAAGRPMRPANEK
jgi:hypothetical protein